MYWFIYRRSSLEQKTAAGTLRASLSGSKTSSSDDELKNCI